MVLYNQLRPHANLLAPTRTNPTQEDSTPLPGDGATENYDFNASIILEFPSFSSKNVSLCILNMRICIPCGPGGLQNLDHQSFDFFFVIIDRITIRGRTVPTLTCGASDVIEV